MKNKIKIISVVALTAISSIVFIEFSSSAGANSSGSPIAKTGSPGDGSNCTQCHNGSATTQAGLITSNIPTTGYIAGQTYTITGSVTTTGRTKFGFQISPQNTNGNLLGSMTVTDASTTKLTNNNKYITHQSTGTSFPSGTATWSFDWTAPAAGTGDVTFYGAFNSSNANNSDSGDIIALSSLTVSENLSTGIANATETTTEVSVYPNPFTDKLFIKNDAAHVEPMNVTITDINGRIVKTINALENNQAIELQELSKGYYSVKIENNNSVVVKNVSKN